MRDDQVDEQVDPIAIFRPDGVVEGWMIRGRERLSDDLNHRVPIPVRYSEDGPWEELPTEDAIAIAAPPREPSAARTARRRHPVEVTAHPYRVHGIGHLPLGADPVRYVRAASQRWLPVTDSTIVTESDGEGFQIDVLLINMDYVVRT
jgi:hypothetical protein